MSSENIDKETVCKNLAAAIDSCITTLHPENMEELRNLTEVLLFATDLANRVIPITPAILNQRRGRIVLWSATQLHRLKMLQAETLSGRSAKH